MGVLVEGISVIVRRDAIEQKIPGGLSAFLATVPSGSYCMDDDLVRVAFMASDDADAYLRRLRAEGLTAGLSDGVPDMAVVNQQSGPTLDAPWLECRSYSREDSATVMGCHAAGSRDSGLAAPAGWNYERSLSKTGFFVPKSEIGREVKFVSSKGDGVEVYRHVATGKTLFVGRTDTVEGRSFDAWMHEGQSRLHAANPSDAVVAFTNASRSRPNDARPWFGLGKSLRGAGRAGDAVPALRTAASLAPDAGEVWHELGVALLESGDADAGIDALRTAVRLSPSQEVVWADLGTALWQAKRHDEAIVAMHEAFDRGASDPLTVRNYRNLCRDAHREPTAVDAFGRVVARLPSEQLQEDTPTEALSRRADGGLLDRARRKIRAVFGARIEP